MCIVAIGDNFQKFVRNYFVIKKSLAQKWLSPVPPEMFTLNFFLRNGADEVVYPERQLADWTAIRYSADHILDYIELDEEHAIFEISEPNGWVGKTIGQLDIRKKYDINIMALKHNGVMNLRISPDTYLPKDDTMLVLGDIKSIQKNAFIFNL